MTPQQFREKFGAASERVPDTRISYHIAILYVPRDGQTLKESEPKCFVTVLEEHRFCHYEQEALRSDETLAEALVPLVDPENETAKVIGLNIEQVATTTRQLYYLAP